MWANYEFQKVVYTKSLNRQTRTGGDPADTKASARDEGQDSPEEGDCQEAAAFLATSLIARAWAEQTTHFIEPPGWRSYLL